MNRNTLLLSHVIGALLAASAAHGQPNCIITNQRVECNNGVAGRVTPRGDVMLDDGRVVRREDLGIVKEREDNNRQPRGRDERRQERER